MTRHNWPKLFCSAMKHLHTDFDSNELAYLALTGKIELTIRDRIAYSLHRQMRDEENIQIAREWKRFDLAIIEESRPVMLVEAKAMYSFDMFANKAKNKYPTKVQKDVKKMMDYSEGKHVSPEIMTLLLATHPYSVPSKELGGIVKYRREIERFTPHSVMALTDAVNKYFGDQSIYEGGEIVGGTAFDTKVSIFYWVFGPYTKAT